MAEPPPTQLPDLRFDLARAPFWSPGLLTVVAVLGVVALTTLDGLRQMIPTHSVEDWAVPLGLLAAVAFTLVAVLARRLWVRLRPLPPVELFAAGLRLPKSIESTAALWVDYRDILPVVVVGSASSPEILIETRGRFLTIPFASLADEGAGARLIEELNRRLLALPNGKALAELIARRRAVAAQALAIRPIVTQTLIGLIVVVFVNQLLLDGMIWPLGPIRWGANAPALVRAGDYFRLVSANFLHGGALHLVVNCLALWVLGLLMERLLGVARFLVLFLGAGLAATVTSVWFSSGSVSVGASGAIFGLLGAMALTNVRFRTELPIGFRQPLRWWLMIFAINAMLPAALPLMGIARIDIAAHLGGFVAGVLLAAVVMPSSTRPAVGTPAGPGTRAAAFTLGLVYLVAMAQAVLYAAGFDDARREAVARALVDSGELEANGYNNLAWELVTGVDTSAAGLALALEAAQKAVADEPKQPAFADTLATAHYRLGNLDAAVEEERRALIMAADATYATQLARFLRARFGRAGPLALNQARLDAVNLRRGEAGADGEPKSLELKLEEPFAAGLTLFALVDRGDEPMGLLAIRIGANPAPTHHLDLAGHKGESLAGTRLRLTVALVDGGAVAGLEPGQLRWELWPHDEAVDELP
jgi:rhomboid protease GluP